MRQKKEQGIGLTCELLLHFVKINKLNHHFAHDFGHIIPQFLRKAQHIPGDELHLLTLLTDIF